MKVLMLLIAVSVLSQTQNSSLAQVAPPARGAAATQSIERRLLDRARAIYGPDVVKTVTIVRGRVTSAVGKASTVDYAGKKADNPAVDDSGVESTKEMSYRGDAASGVILLEEKDALYLDIAPCHEKEEVFVFHSPFAKKHVGSLNCKGKYLDKYSVAQR
jgi:hypothetical protein